MNGIVLTAKLRELDNFKFTPILILTTETGEPRKKEAREAGATGWIEKPFDPDHLLNTINKVI
jgi:two-component system chemotaxis response regulator CheY